MVEHLGIELTQDVRPPVTDPTLGIGVKAPADAAPPAHRLVTIGDSLTHGFQHLAIFNTARSWPMQVAQALGVGDTFNYPHYDPAGPGGNPLNLELLLRHVDRDVLLDIFRVRGFMRDVEEYYETGPGSAYPDPKGPINHNLAVWGWDLRDALERTADIERAEVGPPKGKLIPMVNDPGQRAGVIVLNSARDGAGKALTPLEAARQLGEDSGGIETLCVWLGANNVLGSVISLHVNLSGDGYDDLSRKSAYNVWRVEHFTSELALVAAEIRKVKAQRVLWGTVPHVTIPPIARGLGGAIPECGRYFKYYARPWETEDTFNPGQDSHLTGFDAWLIDNLIDGYNRAIEAVVTQARQDGLDWRIVDMCAVLDSLAVRRNEELRARPDSVQAYPLPDPISDLNVRFFGVDDNGKVSQGGLIGLDGIHPTTCGYGIVAHEFVKAMKAAGVTFPDDADIEFAAVRRSDTLVSDPPAEVTEVISLIGRLNHDYDVLRRLVAHL
jgi:hypothetical protein